MKLLAWETANRRQDYLLTDLRRCLANMRACALSARLFHGHLPTAIVYIRHAKHWRDAAAMVRKEATR